jgi:hypothetical protein
MNNKMKILAALLIAFVPTVKASTLMSYDMGQFTSGGASISSGTVFFISSGADATFDSGIFTVGATSMIKSSDSLLFATAIGAGVASGTWTELYNAPVAVGQNITALFVGGLTSDDVSYTTGAFTGGKSILASGGTSIAFGTYRTSSIDSVGGSVGDAIAWILPANTGGTATLLAYSQTGDYVGTDITANLATSSAFNLGVVGIPEPSSASLLALGMAGLVALRARRKS